MRIRTLLTSAVGLALLGVAVPALVPRAEASVGAIGGAVSDPSHGVPALGGGWPIGAVCAPGEADEVAFRPTGVAADGLGGFYVSDIVHSVVCHVDADGSVVTAAGTGAAGYVRAPLGDEVAADAAMLFDPHGLAVAPNGDLYIADRGNHRIRKVEAATKRISTVAGNGAPARAGDGGLAVDASLRAPSDVAVGPRGELYIADSQNHVVRVVAPDGTITAFAGNGIAGSSGDGGVATSASVNRPVGLAVDAAGRVFIADAGAHRVRMVAGGRISTVVGSGSKGLGVVPNLATTVRLNAPSGVEIDAAGDLVVADSGNSRLLRVAGGVALPLAGTGMAGSSGDGGPALAAALSWPVAVALDPSGRLLVADSGATNRIRAIDTRGTITAAAGNGSPSLSGDGHPADEAELNQPMAVAAGPDGSVWVADAHNDAIRRVGPDGVITTAISPAAGLDFPAGLAVDDGGNVFVADSWGHRVWRLTPGGRPTVVAGTGTATTDPAALGDGGPATSATLNLPVGLAFDAAGRLFIADGGNHRVRMIDTAGVISTVAGTGDRPTADPATTGDGGPATRARLDAPAGLSVDQASGQLYIADPANQRVRRLDLGTGMIATVAGTGRIGFSPDGAVGTDARLNFPRGVAVLGNRLVIADSGNCIVRSLDLVTGRVATIAGWTPARGLTPSCGSVGTSGTGMLNLPTGVTTTADGSVLIADSLNHRVRSVSAS